MKNIKIAKYRYIKTNKKGKLTFAIVEQEHDQLDDAH